jgi:uncharacterized protein YebE (UPF0316 family)
MINEIKKQRVRDSKRYRNEAERDFSDKARENGFDVTKKGYPDFICYGEKGELFFVEVKTKSTQRLKKSQHRLMNALKKHGIKCYKWSPDNDWLTTKHVKQTN